MAVVVTQFTQPISAGVADEDIYACFLGAVVGPENNDPAHFAAQEGTVEFGVMRCRQRIRGRRGGFYLGPRLSMRISAERTLDGEIEIGGLFALPLIAAVVACAVCFVAKDAPLAAYLISGAGSLIYCIWLFSLVKDQESFGRRLVLAKADRPASAKR